MVRGACTVRGVFKPQLLIERQLSFRTETSRNWHSGFEVVSNGIATIQHIMNWIHKTIKGNWITLYYKFHLFLISFILRHWVDRQSLHHLSRPPNYFTNSFLQVIFFFFCFEFSNLNFIWPDMIQLVWACTEHVFLNTPSTQAFVGMKKLAHVFEYIKVCTAQVFAGTGNHTQVCGWPRCVRKYVGDPGVYASVTEMGPTMQHACLLSVLLFKLNMCSSSFISPFILVRSWIWSTCVRILTVPHDWSPPSIDIHGESTTLTKSTDPFNTVLWVLGGSILEPL